MKIIIKRKNIKHNGVMAASAWQWRNENEINETIALNLMKIMKIMASISASISK
jgi:hypothetical protein